MRSYLYPVNLSVHGKRVVTFLFLKKFGALSEQNFESALHSPCGELLMPPHENRARLTETTMRGNRYTRDAVDLEPSVRRLGEQLRRQFSDIASEPLPDDMLALLEELSQVSAAE
jgi:hypothetical protein